MDKKHQRHGIFISGGTGYIGTHLVPELLKRGHKVTVLARKGSEHKVNPKAKILLGNPLEHESFKGKLKLHDTFVQLAGTSHPSPWKAKKFKSVDLQAVKSSIKAIKGSSISHYIYMSVAHPAPVMKSYLAARIEAEKLIKKRGINATFLRPLYVLGPGHYWPYLILPFYWIFERLPATKDAANRLGLVTLNQMIKALVYAIENQGKGIKVIDVPAIRSLGGG